MTPSELQLVLSEEWVNDKGTIIVQLPSGFYTYVESAERDSNGDIRLKLADIGE